MNSLSVKLVNEQHIIYPYFFFSYIGMLRTVYIFRENISWNKKKENNSSVSVSETRMS